MPVTGPRHVEPVNGTRISLLSSVAVPDNVMAQLETVGLAPVPVAVQAIESPDIVPVAVPATATVVWHVAVNEPDAVLPVMLLTTHTKFVHVLVSVVTDETDDHVPLSAWTPVAVDVVEFVVCDGERMF